MNLQTLIRSRRSVGAFKNEPVSTELINELLASAVYAPNHRKTEPWRFIVINGDARRQYAEIRAEMVLENMAALDEAERQKAADGTVQKFTAVPLFLLAVMKEHEKTDVREEDYAATACVVQNFLLLAWDQGLGTCWKTFKNSARLREFLGLADDEKVVGIVHVGYPDEAPSEGKRQPIDNRITILG